MIAGDVTFGCVVAFIVYLQLFTQPPADLLVVALNLRRTVAAAKRVFEFLAQEEETDESGKTKRLENVRGDVEFKNATFGYSPERPVIKNFSRKFRAGQKIAIVGATGAGKTTLVNLPTRFYEIDDGDITLDGVSIKEPTRENVREQFCVVLQDAWLFCGSIRENVVYNRENVSDADLDAAATAADSRRFILGTADGYETILDDDADLSAGNKRLLTISRALLSKAPILILDEATSAVDAQTERTIQKTVDEMTEGRTSFVIARRFSTIRNADVVLVMQDGEVVESGAHEELIALNGVYAELYRNQFSD